MNENSQKIQELKAIHAQNAAHCPVNGPVIGDEDDGHGKR